MNILQRIADELTCKVFQVEAVVTLLDEGATVSFISHYRKEAAGGLNETRMRDL